MPSWRDRTLFEKIEVLFFFAVALGVLLTFARVAAHVSLPFQIDFGEGYTLAGASRIAQGLSAYPRPTEPPYVIECYGPIPLYLMALCVKAFGLSFTMPRILVIAAGVWCAVLIALLLGYWGGSRQVALAFGLLYLTRPLLQIWLFRARVDLIGLAFALTGFYIFARWRHWYFSVPFFVSAVFCKLTFVAAPLACFLYAALRGEGQKALRLAAWCLVLGGLVFLYAQRETQGWFAFHTIWGNAGHPYSLLHAAASLRTEMAGDYFLFVLALVLAYYVRARPELWLAPIYLGLSFLVSLTVGKMGSDSNYFLEWQAVLCLCAGLGYQLMRTHCDLGSVIPSAFPVTLALLTLVGFHGVTLDPGFVGYAGGCRQAYDRVKNHPGRRILSDNLGALVMAEKPFVVFEPFQWGREVLSAGWSDADVVGMIRSRQVDLIVVDEDVETMKRDPMQDRWPPDVVDAIQQNYRRTEESGCPYARIFYEPKPPR